ncbi:MAG: GAF domain-containing protein [Anaerolineaceae bacterium]|nr:GAF domain-containing protein [Anaerolineaceae bacterium]
MELNLYTLIPIFACIIYGAILLVVSLGKPQTSARRAFRVYLIAMFGWSATSLVILAGFGDAVFWFRLMIASALGSMLGIFYFVQVFLSRQRRWAWVVYLYGIGAILFMGVTDLVVKSAYIVEGALHYEYNNLIILVAGPGYLLTIFSLVELIRGYQQIGDILQRIRLRYLMLSLGLIIAASLSNWTPLGKYPIDIAANGFSALLIAYTILRHKLLDISVVIRQGLLYSIPTTIIGAAYFLIISLSLRIFEAYSGLQIFLLSMVVAILTALLVQPLRDRAQAFIDKIFFREKYDSSLMLQRVSQTAATFLEVELLSNMILEEVVSILQIKNAAFFLRNKTTKEFRLTAQSGMSKNMNIKFRSDHPIVLRLSVLDIALTRQDTNVMPHFKSLWGQERNILEHLGAELYIPLKTQGNLIGILTVGQKRSEEPFSNDDLLTLTTLANQTAVAFENARLYTAEQTRRMELDALYSLSRQLIASDGLDIVLDNVASHALESIHVTFSRILLHNEDNSYTCSAAYPVFGLDYDLRLNKREPKNTHRFYYQAMSMDRPLIIDRNKTTLNYNDLKALYLDHVHSLCLCPLRVGDEEIGILILGERRSTTRESFDSDKLRLAAAIADQSASAIRRALLHDQLEESYVQTVVALANAIDARDSYTSGHGVRLTQMAIATARKLNCSEEEIQVIQWAMLLHDIGKIGVSDGILLKHGPLDDDEWIQMKAHPLIGANIVAPVKKLENVAPLIRAHHERYDGTGYPDQLSGNEIPLGARILTVVDTYGAITDNRIYRKARTHSEAIDEIVRCVGVQFDPEVSEAFFQVIEENIKVDQQISGSVLTS